jgi:hypothetical protein
LQCRHSKKSKGRYCSKFQKSIRSKHHLGTRCRPTKRTKVRQSKHLMSPKVPKFHRMGRTRDHHLIPTLPTMDRPSKLSCWWRLPLQKIQVLQST